MRELVRSKQAEYEAAGLDADSTDEALLEAIARTPILMERPILIRGPRAEIGRPPENVLPLLDD